MRHLIALTLVSLLVACSDNDTDGDVAPADTGTDTVVDAPADTPDADGDSGTDSGDDAEADPDADAEDADASLPPADEWEPIERTEQQDGASLGRWTPGDDVREGTARIGEHPAGYSHFSGPEARCRPGDFVLQNAAVSACIASALRPSQYTFTGGYLLDIAPADERDGEMLEMVAPGSDLRNVFADTFEVVRDGSDGGSVVLRVSGDILPIMAVANFLGGLLNGEPIRVETEYRLAPDDASLEAVTWLWGTDPDLMRARVEVGDMLLGGDHVTHWSPGFGPIASRVSTETDLWVGLSNSFAYGVWSPEMVIGAFAPGVLDSDLDPAVMTRGVIGPETVATFVRRYAVGRDTVEVRANLAPHHQPLEGETVQFAGPAEEGFPERRYAIRNSDGELEVIRLAPDGTGTAALPAGSYTAQLFGSADPAWSTSFNVPADAPVELGHPEFGSLRIWVDEDLDAGVQPSPAQVDLLGPTSGQFHIVRGAGHWLVAPGSYEILISRGEEFSISEHSVEVVVDEETMVNASIARLMDTEGWASGDFHMHQRRSIDSAVENTTRVESNLAHGLDFMAPSDHDAVEDFPRIVADMGVEDLIFAYPGSEVSPAWGHTNHFPLHYDPSLPGFGSVPLSRFVDGEIVTITGPEIAAAGRALGAEVIQINHPREGSGFLNQGEYDPVLGPTETDDEYFFADFDSIEVVNSPGDTCLVMRDWFSFLAHGLSVAGIGNSDSHGLGDPVGWPRNYVLTGDAELSDAVISEAVVAMQVSVSGGIFLDFFDAMNPGDHIAISEAGSVPFSLRAQTPTWIRAENVIVYVNGVEVDRFTIDSEDEAIVDFEEVVDVEITADSFVVFFAFTNARQPIVTPGEHIFGFTNPIFVDVGDDGWTAPGVASEEALPLPSGIPFCSSEKNPAPPNAGCGH